MKLKFQSKPVIDGGERPDFLFPGKAEYESETFRREDLRMLAVKFTAKDRWRQVLNEAAKIPRKHLLTLEPTISTNQLALMKTAMLQLVIPIPLQSTYPQASRASLISLRSFLEEVQKIQKTKH